MNAKLRNQEACMGNLSSSVGWLHELHLVGEDPIPHLIFPSPISLSKKNKRKLA